MSGSVADRIVLEGTSLVEAGAGTGKTHTIVELYTRLLCERGLGAPEILVVTYTIAATSELRARIRSHLAVQLGLGERPPAELARLRQALRDFDRAPIVTIHGFCQRALSAHAFESARSFESELVSEGRPLFEEVAQDFWVRELHAAPDFLVERAQESRLRIAPRQLADLAERAAARPDAELRPPRRPVPDLAALEKSWREAFEKVSAAWPSARDEAIELLAVAAERGHLNGNRYKPDPIRSSWRAEIDREIRRGRPGIPHRFEKAPLLGSSRMAVNRNKPAPEHPFFELWDTLVAAEEEIAKALEAWTASFRHDFLAYARDELPRRKARREVLLFDDLVQGLRDALAGEGGEAVASAIGRRHPVALIDEFQDTDPVQYEIFRRIWHGRPGCGLVLIGDPKQAIYAFRGADVLAYLEARGDAADAVHGLARSWRADPALVTAQNALFGGAAPFGREEIRYPPATARAGARDLLDGPHIRSGLRILWASAPDGKPEIPAPRAGDALLRGVAGEVARVLTAEHRIDGARLRPGDLAVLTRTNRQARLVQAALRAVGIAGVLQSEESVFATDEAAELERILRAVAEPESPARLRAALATTPFGIDAGALLALGSDEQGRGWDAWVSLLRDCRRLWVERSVVEAWRRLWVGRNVAASLLTRPDGERRVTNLVHLIELLHRAAVEDRLGPQALLYWLSRRRLEAEGAGSTDAEDAQLRLESDADAVQLLTVHRSKGLEFPVTICPFLWDAGGSGRNEPVARYHDPLGGELVLDAEVGGDGERLAERESHEESLRLAYVALTRARHHCTVVWGRFANAGGSPLAHLLHPPEPGEPGPGEKGARARLKQRSDASLRADLERLARAGGGSVVVEDLTPPDGGSASDIDPESSGPAAELAPARAARSFSNTWRLSSFSGLVSSTRELADARDRDAFETGSAAPASDGSGEPVALAEFPAGAIPGIAVHEIFEKLDFLERDRAPDALPSLVATALARRGLAPRWSEPLCAALRDLLEVPLDDALPESRLGALARSDRLDEMEFVLPVGDEGRSLTAEALGRVFAEHATAPWVRRYAARAAALGFPALAGHLRGFIDLVARWNGRYAVIDYKSNRLGGTRASYAPSELEAAMAEHDYVLQYHLYLVALHRHLGLRLSGYDYDAHVGGAFYLFVRGMSTSHPPAWGIVRDRPPRALIEALSELFG